MVYDFGYRLRALREQKRMTQTQSFQSYHQRIREQHQDSFRRRTDPIIHFVRGDNRLSSWLGQS